MTSDPRDEFLKNVDFQTMEVREYPKIAFLCGGNPEVFCVPAHESAPSEQYFPSVRSFISSLLSINYPSLRYKNAEDVKDWNSYSAYEDLIEFEKDIAHLCKAIVLFVESAGSIAELGSFAIIPEITEKLVVFVHSDYSASTSFVSLGPLKRINDANAGRIHYITWGQDKKSYNSEIIDIVKPETLVEWGAYTCEAIKSALESKLYIDHSSDKYIRTKEALFIHDVVSLFKAIDEDEIRKYFALVNHDVEKKLIQRSIFCLAKLELIWPVTRGNKTYYVPDNPSASRYLSLPISSDSARLAMQLVDYYKHPTQLARREAIQEIIGGGR